MHAKFYIQPRLIALIGLTIALIMIIGSIQRSRQARDEMYNVLEEEALSLVETIDLASKNIILSSDEIERQISGRLLTAGRLIARMDSAGIFHTSDLNRIADENKIFRINIFNRKGERVLSNHTPHPAHRALMQGGSPQETLKPLLQGTADHLVIGIKKARFETGERFAVAVRRIAHGGGAIVLNIDVTDFTELKKNIGIGKLIRDLGNNSGIEYAALQDTDGVIVASDSVDQLSSFANDTALVSLWKTDSTLMRQALFHQREVYEVLKPLTIENTCVGIIRIGLSLDEVRAIERQAQHRNLMRTLVLIFVAFLTITALIASQNYRLSRQRISAMETFTGSILEQMQDAVITIDANMRITIFNRQAERLFLVKEQEIVGKVLTDIASTNLQCLQVIFSGDTFLPAELTVPCGDGTIHVISVTLTKLPSSTTAVIRDLTESKRFQQEIERREKLSAMGELAAGVAHEIRNPLNAISIIAQRYEKEFTPRSGTREYRSLTQVLKKESARVNNIIQQFLAFARPAKLKFAEVSAQLFVNHVSTLFQGQAAVRKIQFVSRCDYDGKMRIDHDTMTQAVLNLLQNALDATPQHKSITMNVFRKEYSIILEIQDTGKGIPKEHLEKIFNLYFTTKTNGSGMGLAITQQIISQHRGSIQVKSEASQGTTFTISLPFVS